jgi:serine/threonine protein kinase
VLKATLLKAATRTLNNPQLKNNIGHYVLGRAIGQGTFGKVRNGTHIITGEKVSVTNISKSNNAQ